MREIADGIIAIVLMALMLIFTAAIMIGIFLVLTAPFWFIPLIIVAMGKVL